MKILVAYDGTLHSKVALEYGIQKVREKGGELLVIHVFQGSLFVDYDAGPRALEAARDESRRHIEEAKRVIEKSGSGVKVGFMSEEGDPEEIIVRYATDEQVDLVLVPPRYKAVVKTAPAPVYIIPGTILVPVDNTDGPLATMDNIIGEAKATGSQVMILGLVPIHLYGRWEKKELGKLKKETAAKARKLKKTLNEHGIQASETIRSGYSDEEILKAADEYSVSMIILPTGGTTPSELSKAAAVILDEPERLKRPVILLPVTGAA
jgi:nucleotide-binding universal stress UspA family protein